MPQDDTEELMNKAEAGDNSAVQELLVRHSERLNRVVALRMDDRLKSRFDSSDVVQEGLITATGKLPAYLKDRPLPFYPWLRRIVVERLVDLHRKHLVAEGRSVSREVHWNLCDESVSALALKLVGNENSPSGNVVQSETETLVRRALEDLSHEDRDLLLMRYLEQLGVAEIAAILEISQPAVKSRLRRALERLHAALGNEISEGEP